MPDVILDMCRCVKHNSLSLESWLVKYARAELRNVAYTYKYESTYSLVNYFIKNKKQADLALLLQDSALWDSLTRTDDSAKTPLQYALSYNDPKVVEGFLNALPSRDLLRRVLRGLHGDSSRMQDSAIALVISKRASAHLDVLINIAKKHQINLLDEGFLGEISRFSADSIPLCKFIDETDLPENMLENLALSVPDFHAWCHRHQDSLSKYKKLSKYLTHLALIIELHHWVLDPNQSIRYVSDSSSRLMAEIITDYFKLFFSILVGQNIRLDTLIDRFLNYFVPVSDNLTYFDDVFFLITKMIDFFIFEKKDSLRNLINNLAFDQLQLTSSTESSLNELKRFVGPLSQEICMILKKTYHEQITLLSKQGNGVSLFVKTLHAMLMLGFCFNVFRQKQAEAIIIKMTQLCHVFPGSHPLSLYYAKLAEQSLRFSDASVNDLRIIELFTNIGFRYVSPSGLSLYFYQIPPETYTSPNLISSHFRSVSLEWLYDLHLLARPISKNQTPIDENTIIRFASPPIRFNFRQAYDDGALVKTMSQDILTKYRPLASNSRLSALLPSHFDKLNLIDEFAFNESISSSKRYQCVKALLSMQTTLSQQSYLQFYSDIGSSLRSIIWQLSEVRRLLDEIFNIRNILNHIKSEKSYFYFRPGIDFYIRRLLLYKINKFSQKYFIENNSLVAKAILKLQHILLCSHSINLYGVSVDNWRRELSDSRSDYAMHYDCLIELANDLKKVFSRMDAFYADTLLHQEIFSATRPFLYINMNELDGFHGVLFIVPLQNWNHEIDSLSWGDIHKLSVQHDILHQELTHWEQNLINELTRLNTKHQLVQNTYDDSVRLWMETISEYKPQYESDFMHAWIQHVCLDLNAVLDGDFNKKTLLIKAIEHKDLELCRLLEHAGANPLSMPRIYENILPISPLMVALTDRRIRSKEMRKILYWLLEVIEKEKSMPHLWATQDHKDKFYQALKTYSDGFISYLDEYIRRRWRLASNDTSHSYTLQRYWNGFTSKLKLMTDNFIIVHGDRSHQVSKLLSLWQVNLNQVIPDLEMFYSDLTKYHNDLKEIKVGGKLIDGLQKQIRSCNQLRTDCSTIDLQTQIERDNYHSKFLDDLASTSAYSKKSETVYTGLDREKKYSYKIRAENDRAKAQSIELQKQELEQKKQGLEQQIQESDLQREELQRQKQEAERQKQEAERQKQEAERQKQEAERQKQEAELINRNLIDHLLRQGVFKTREEALAVCSKGLSGGALDL